MVEIQEKSKVHILVVRIHLDRDFSDTPALAVYLFTIHYYLLLSKIAWWILVKSE